MTRAPQSPGARRDGRDAAPAVARLLALTVPMFAGACGGDAGRIGTGPDEWQLTGPDVTIGVLEGDENYQFEALSAAWKTSHGRIIVSDRGQSSILVYDASGRFLKRFAREGEGPGELRRMGRAFPYHGDSIAVFDLGMLRMSIFDGEGAFARAFPNPVTYVRRAGVVPSQSCCQINGAFADGSFVVRPPDDIPNQPGPPRYGTLSLIRLSPEGEQADTIGSFASGRYEYDASAPSDVRDVRTVLSFVYAVAPDAVIGGNAEDNVVIIATADGARLDTIRLGPPPPPFTDAMIDEREQLLREDYAKRPQFYEGGLESFLGGNYPERAPAYSQIEVDRQGRIWVREWTLAESAYQAEPAGQRYRIHARTGEALATVLLPPASRLAWAGELEIMLIERDSVDVQYVRMYGIEPVR